MKRILVTGANGHLGANTVRSLLRRGYEVAPFVRRTSNLRGIEKLGLTCRYGDVLDYDSIARAAEGCDAIIHHAAVYHVWAKDVEEIIRPAVEGTRNVLRAARQAGVGRLVYTSSVAAVGSLERPADLLTSADWNLQASSPYYIAKTRSEQEAVRLSIEYNVPTIRLCPSLVLGPYDYALTPSNGLIRNYVNGALPTFEGGANYVHVLDVAEAHAAALELGEPGGRYIIGGTNLHLKEVAAVLQKLAGVKPLHVATPRAIALAFGAILGFAGRVSGKEPMFDDKVIADVVRRYAFVDSRPAYETFGITPRSAEEAVSDTIRWLLFLGKIKPDVARRIAPAFPPDPAW